TDQWNRNTENREEILSCQLADLASVPTAVVDINECILLDGSQEPEVRNNSTAILEDVRQFSNGSSFRPSTLPRSGAEASRAVTQEVPMNESYQVQGDVARPSLQNENKSIPHSTPLTLNWLSENYELAEGVCIPRNVIYKHYCDFCQKNGMIPIIRQKFKMVKNRRLGTRGYSTYHYYGIGIRILFFLGNSGYKPSEELTSLRNLQDDVIPVFSGPSTNSVSRGHLSLTTVPVLEFPNLQDVPLPSNVPHQLFRSFFTMYRAHCLRIFNSICRNELDEVQEFLSHFWKGVPLHLMGILGSNAVVNMVGVCDSVLYRSIAAIFVPSTRKTSPVLLTMLKKLVPLLDVAHHFCRILRRLISLNQIWLSVALLLQNADSISKMLADWRGTNVEQICSEVAFGIKWPETRHIMFSLVERCVTSIARERGCPVKRVARHFLLIWVTVGTRVLRDLTLTSTHSFAHCVELLEAEERTTEMMRNISIEVDSSLNIVACSKQNIPSSTITSQDILGEHSFKYEYRDEAVISSAVPFTYQTGLNGVINVIESKINQHSFYLIFKSLSNFGSKDGVHGSHTQDNHSEDCRYNSTRRYEYVDLAPATVICTTSSCAYQGYQQYTMTDCHANRSASLPPT
ncbi:hypothetical protein C0J52_05872, partial [Blattella germanica]